MNAQQLQRKRAPNPGKRCRLADLARSPQRRRSARHAGLFPLARALLLYRPHPLRFLVRQKPGVLAADAVAVAPKLGCHLGVGGRGPKPRVAAAGGRGVLWRPRIGSPPAGLLPQTWALPWSPRDSGRPRGRPTTFQTTQSTARRPQPAARGRGGRRASLQGAAAPWST